MEKNAVRVVNIWEKAVLIHILHSHKIMARTNDYLFTLVKATRAFAGIVIRKLTRFSSACG